MRKLYLLMSVVAAFFINNGLAALPATIKFATEATYPPFESMDASGQIKGFDIDIANALCAQMQVQCTFVNQPWDSLIPSLKLGKVDALIGAMAITDERKQQVDFTDPYYKPTGSFVAAKNSKLQLTKPSLQGKTIGVQAGTTFIQYLQAIYGDAIKINTYPSEQDAFLDLQSGRVDAVLGDTPLVKAWLTQTGNASYQIIGMPISDPKYLGQGDGIAVRKNSPELLAAFNKALQTIKANGTYDKIIATDNFK